MPTNLKTRSLPWSKTQDKASKHRLRRVAQIVTKLELAKVLRQMLPGNVDVRPANRAFDHRPEAFEAVRVRVSAHPFLLRVIDGAVDVSLRRNAFVRRVLVGADDRRFLNIGLNVRVERDARRVRDDLRHHVAVPLQHPENDGLAAGTATAPSGAMTAYERFVGLYMAF